MPRDVRIRTFRSTTEGVRPPTTGADGITAGELATNLADKLLFVGASDGGYITYRNDAQTVWTVNGATGNVGLKYATARDPDDLVNVPGVTGVATYWCENFVVAANGMVKLGTCCSTFCEGGPPGGQFPPDANLYYGGIAATFGSDGGLSAFVMDIGGLTEDTSSSRTQYVPFVSSDGKTKKIKAEKFITNMSSVFNTKGSDQLTINPDTGNNNIDFQVVLGAVAAGDQGLVKGASAYQYIVLNTVKSVNGQTGDIGCIAVTCAGQTFSGLQSFTEGITVTGLTATDPVILLTYPTGTPGNLTIDSRIGGQVFKNRFTSTAFGQYSWMTNLRRSNNGWFKDQDGYSSWRMNQAVAATDTNSVLQWSYATPGTTTLNELLSLYGYGDLRIHSGRLVANGATFSGNVSAPNIVNSVNGLTGVVGLPLATAGVSGIASFNSTHFSVSNTGHVSLPAGVPASKTYSVFTARDNHPQSTNFATFDTRNSIGVLDFDGITNESAVFVSIMPEGASYTNLQARLKWMTSSALTGSVMWGVKWEQGTSSLSSDDWSPVTELLHTIAGPGSTASGVPYTTAITCTGAFDGITAGDLYRLYVYRGATATTDDIATDVELIAVEVRGV